MYHMHDESDRYLQDVFNIMQPFGIDSLLIQEAGQADLWYLYIQFVLHVHSGPLVRSKKIHKCMVSFVQLMLLIVLRGYYLLSHIKT